MQTQKSLSFITLLLMISFASVNAVLFTPALPDIATFFTITEGKSQLTLTWFLIGYALGQLIYGPVSNRLGRKPALYAGISLQIISSLLCVLAGGLHNYSLLVFARFLLALGSGVGIKMTFTLVNESYPPKIVSQKIAYLMLAFAITPGLSIALGGFLNAHYGWMSCFYASAVYGLVLLLLTTRLPETLSNPHLNALKLSHLLPAYQVQFKNAALIAGGLLMGSCTAFVYVFAALAPFLAINLLGMSSAQYGTANLLPALGLIAGSLCSARLVNTYSLQWIIRTGIVITVVGALLMSAAVVLHASPVYSLFTPMIIIYFGLSLVLANASTVAMSQVSDKSHGSAVMNFINMGLATLIVLSLGLFTMQLFLLPGMFVVISICMLWLYKRMAACA